ncbi:MAG: carbohydrate kinase family protein [Nanoarchaeota archaeon]|nr:carbohydrate kinase family protein [Nanoarchaeota archaeon]MBU1631616.1 carbohydrate kinase family protein [Nanoarchaeota archaeon]MBU1876631.1 carbohydrate kinase family protein [Nanoarchaeota archaeon]
MFKYDVLCIGSATVDSFLTIEQPLQEVKLGDKVLVNSVEKHSGGGATNSAAALSKLGLSVKILTKMGGDHDADFIIKELKEYKIKNICQHHSIKNTDSGTIISSVKEKDRIIYVHKGASLDLSSDDFKKSQLNTKWIYLASLMGKSFQTTKKIISYAEKKKVKILFNASSYLAKKGKNYLKSILKATSILVLNKEEAQALLKSSSNNSSQLLRSLHQFGPETVVITNGNKALYALHDNVVYSLIPPKVKIVHTAGAGDAFTAGLLAGIIKNYSFENALRLGQVNSSSVIQHIGTKNKLLTEREAQQLIKRYNIKVTKNIKVKKMRT